MGNIPSCINYFIVNAQLDFKHLDFLIENEHHRTRVSFFFSSQIDFIPDKKAHEYSAVMLGHGLERHPKL